MEPRYLDEMDCPITACGVWENGKQCAQRLKECEKPAGAKSAHGLCHVHGAVPLYPFLEAEAA